MGEYIEKMNSGIPDLLLICGKISAEDMNTYRNQLKRVFNSETDYSKLLLQVLDTNGLNISRFLSMYDIIEELDIGEQVKEICKAVKRMSIMDSPTRVRQHYYKLIRILKKQCNIKDKLTFIKIIFLHTGDALTINKTKYIINRADIDKNREYSIFDLVSRNKTYENIVCVYLKNGELHTINGEELITGTRDESEYNIAKLVINLLNDKGINTVILNCGGIVQDYLEGHYFGKSDDI